MRISQAISEKQKEHKNSLSAFSTFDSIFKYYMAKTNSDLGALQNSLVFNNKALSVLLNQVSDPLRALFESI